MSNEVAVVLAEGQAAVEAARQAGTDHNAVYRENLERLAQAQASARPAAPGQQVSAEVRAEAERLVAEERAVEAKYGKLYDAGYSEGEVADLRSELAGEETKGFASAQSFAQDFPETVNLVNVYGVSEAELIAVLVRIAKRHQLYGYAPATPSKRSTQPMVSETAPAEPASGSGLEPPADHDQRQGMKWYEREIAEARAEGGRRKDDLYQAQQRWLARHGHGGRIVDGVRTA